ncbi:MAG: hypothetical protein Q4D91_05245 [Lautropia sp.]|nr:hypothetical protein [Lautropia sp.]
MLTTIFAFLAFGSLSLLALGILFPRMVIRSGNASRGRVIKVYGSYFILFIGSAIFSVSSAEKVKSGSLPEDVAEVNRSESVVPEKKEKMVKAALVDEVGEEGRDSESSGLSDEELKALEESKLRLADEDRVTKILRKEARSEMTVDSVNKNKKTGKFRIVLSYKPSAVWNEASYVSGLSHRIVDLGQAIQKHAIDVEYASFVAFGNYVDSYGNESQKKVLTIDIPEVDYSRINWKNITHWDILDISEVSLRPVGRSAAKRFCEDSSNKKGAAVFCSAVLSGRKKEAKSALASMSGSESQAVTESRSVDSRSLINLDFSTFVKRVNNDLKVIDSPYRLSLQVKRESFGESLKGATFELNDNLSALVTMDSKSNKLSKILVTTVPGYDSVENFDNAFAAIMLASAPAGRDGEKTVGKRLFKMYAKVGERFSSSGGLERDSFVQGGVRYGISMSKMTGVWVFAEPA